MTRNQTSQPERVSPSMSDEPPTLLYLKVLRAAMQALVGRDGENEGLRNPRARALLRELGIGREEHTDVTEDQHTVLTELDSKASQHSTSRTDESSPIDELAKDLGKVFGYDVSEQRLLALALHANRSRKLQRAMNLIGEVDDGDAAQLFAEILDLEHDATVAALRKPSPFHQMQPYEVMRSQATPFAFIKFSGGAAHIVRHMPNLDAMLAVFCRPAPKAKLAIADFDHQKTEINLLRRYLRSTLDSTSSGVNVLLHGAPGTGKTELVRTLCASLEGQLLEVPAVDEDKDPLPPWKRLTAFTATQELMRNHGATVVLFDEVEDVFPREGRSAGGRAARQGSDRHKAWLTQLLEQNPCPTFWVCNEIDHIDPAYLRRFDMVIELFSPSRAARDRMIDQLFSGVALGPRDLGGLKAELALAPAHLEKLAGVLKAVMPANEAEGGELLGILETQLRNALDIGARPLLATRGLSYRPDCINTDVNLEALSAALELHPWARICLFGPPGTGKTEWARQLASRLGRPLHVKRPSDLLSKYIGDSERLIRQAFYVASREGAVLLIDEADGLLRDRASADHGWEVSMVNELLTSIETFDGIFVASTNLHECLDPASARRFDFKVRFDYLSAGQARQMFDELARALGIELDARWIPSMSKLLRLAPGDFANVYRQARLMPIVSADDLVDLLVNEESAGTSRGPKSSIGFIRNV